MKIKEFLGVVLFGIAFIGIILTGIDRFEKIESSEMILVNQNEMDR